MARFSCDVQRSPSFVVLPSDQGTALFDEDSATCQRTSRRSSVQSRPAAVTDLVDGVMHASKGQKGTANSRVPSRSCQVQSRYPLVVDVARIRTVPQEKFSRACKAVMDCPQVWRPATVVLPKVELDTAPKQTFACFDAATSSGAVERVYTRGVAAATSLLQNVSRRIVDAVQDQRCGGDILAGEGIRCEHRQLVEIAQKWQHSR